MKHIKTLNAGNLRESAMEGGCGECQASCQSACKTSCTVANQKCKRPQTTLSELNSNRPTITDKFELASGNKMA